MNRRTFIVKNGIASLGILAGASAYAITPRNSNSVVNIGIIGTGSRGAGLIPVINEIEGLNISAVCDTLPFRLEDGLARTKHKTAAYTDYRKLLDDKDVDAVLIATPFSTHSSIAIDAIDAGKHVYCEKTMAKSLLGIDKLVKKASGANTIFQVGHQYHSSRLYEHIVELIEHGELGQITSFECQWNRNGNWRRPVPDPSLERAINWRMYREYSGGLAAELCSHQIEFVHRVLGENPRKIMGTGGINYWKDGRETFDNIHLLFEYPSGVNAQFTCLTANALGDYQIKIHGSKATVLLDYTEAWIYYEKDDYDKEWTNVDGVSGATPNSHMQGKGVPIPITHMDPSKQALVDFRASIIDNKMPSANIFVGANTAVAVQLSLDAMYNENIQYWTDAYSY